MNERYSINVVDRRNNKKNTLMHYAKVNIHRIWEQLNKSKSKSGLVSFFYANFPLFLNKGLRSF